MTVDRLFVVIMFLLKAGQPGMPRERHAGHSAPTLSCFLEKGANRVPFISESGQSTLLGGRFDLDTARLGQFEEILSLQRSFQQEGQHLRRTAEAGHAYL